MKGNSKQGIIRNLSTLMVFIFIFSNILPFVTVGESATDISLDMVTLVGDLFESNDMGSNWDPQNKNGVMNQYKDNIYEISLLLKPGTYEYKAALNGGWDESYSNANSNVNGGDGGNAILVLNTEKVVHFRFDNHTKKLYDSENNSAQFKQSATLVGNLSEITEDGKWWDPSDSNFDLEYIGGGFYRGAFELDTGQLEYKVAFNHAWDNGELGDDGNNIKISIKSKGMVTFLVDTLKGIVYDSIRNPEIKNVVSLIGPIRTAIDSNIGSNNEWTTELEGFEFYPISDYECAYTALLPKGTYEYKGIENYSWDGGGLPPTSENYEITISSDWEYVVFIVDLREKIIINSIDNIIDVANRLGIGENPYEEKSKIVRFKYIRPDGDYEGWNIWVWYTGVKDGQIDFAEIKDGIAIANIKVSPDTERIGFVLRKGTNWEEKDAYSEDRYIEIDENERVTKVIVTSGVGEFEQPPSIKGPEFKDGKIVFYYRDSELYADDLMHTIEDVKLKIVASDDEESDYKLYDMTYSDVDEYFYYEFEPKQGIERYEYSFIVTYEDGSTEEVVDPYNPGSYVEYKNEEFDIDWDIQPREIDYNQNAVISIELSDDTVELKEVYLDLTSLGGPKKYQVDTELMQATIAVKDSIVAGDKKIPITVVDKYGNTHVENAEISIKTRLIEAGDFDWDEAIIYFLLTDRFMNGDPTNDDPNGEQYDKSHPETYHGGDLKGVTEKLDYLKDLGVNTIWITPIVDNIDFNKGADFTSLPEEQRYQYGYHGYWAQDFTRIDEHLGTLEDLHRLIDEAHDRDMKIMVDVVLNHAGYGLKPGDEEKWGHLSNFPSEEVRNKFYVDINGERFSMFRDGGSDEIKGELAGLPDFMTEIPEVREQIIKWQTDWLDMAKTEKGNTIDYFRVDTVKHVEDTTWKAFKNRLTEKVPNFKLIGEYFGASVNNTFDSELDKGKMDSLLDFDFKHKAKDFADGKIDEVEEYLEYRNGKLSNTATLGQFLSSHDEDGFLYRVDGDVGKLKVASALQITAKGQPVIYYGEELGMTGKNAGDMSRGEFSENRYDMDWDRLNNDEYRHIYEHYKTLLNIRSDYSKLFAKGDRQKVAGSDAEKYVVFKRVYDDQSVYIGINVENEAKEITIKTVYPSGTEIEDLYSSKNYTVEDDGKLMVSIPAASDGGTVVLILKDIEEPKEPDIDEEVEEEELKEQEDIEKATETKESVNPTEPKDSTDTTDIKKYVDSDLEVDITDDITEKTNNVKTEDKGIALYIVLAIIAITVAVCFIYYNRKKQKVSQ
ncbi:MAG TPA: pullulanase [Clostridiales bacterium]|nr:pullulanase [Clostridiales bacterium]